MRPELRTIEPGDGQIALLRRPKARKNGPLIAWNDTFAQVVDEMMYDDVIKKQYALTEGPAYRDYNSQRDFYLRYANNFGFFNHNNAHRHMGVINHVT